MIRGPRRIYSGVMACSSSGQSSRITVFCATGAVFFLLNIKPVKKITTIALTGEGRYIRANIPRMLDVTMTT